MRMGPFDNISFVYLTILYSFSVTYKVTLLDCIICIL